MNLLNSCGQCKDGYIYKTDSNGIEFAERCKCLLTELLRQRMISANIFESYQPYLDLSGVTPKNTREQKTMRQMTRQYIQGIQENYLNGRGLYLYGSDRGTGKTTHLLSVLKAALELGRTARNVHWSNVLDMSIRDKDELDAVLNMDFLMVDEVGKDSGGTESNFVKSTFEYLMRHRISINKPLLMASNLEDGELEAKFGDGVMSLFHGKITAIHVSGPDWRKGV